MEAENTLGAEVPETNNELLEETATDGEAETEEADFEDADGEAEDGGGGGDDDE